ncbi:MAG: hypothetical protein QME81_19560, partial [bacterium]|nr:hypothetical protein [bacterium]
PKLQSSTNPRIFFLSTIVALLKPGRNFRQAVLCFFKKHGFYRPGFGIGTKKIGTNSMLPRD